MADPLVWLIIALFYAPLHYLVPLLAVIMRSSEHDRQAHMRQTLVDCTVSMLAGLALATWLWSSDAIGLAMAVMLASMSLPYLRIVWRRTRG